MEINATKREQFGRKTKALRKDRQIPAVVYGNKIEPTSLTINTNEFIKVFKEAGETTLIDLKFNDTNEKVLVKEVQTHPVTGAPLHVSFHKVDLTEKIKANVPVEVIGEEDCAVVKSGEGMVLVLMNEIEVEALPSDLPSGFEVDVSHLAEIDAAVTVSELKFDKEKVELVDLEGDEFVVKIDHAVREEEEEEEIDEEALIEGMEVTGEKEDTEEGEEGAEKAEEKPAEEEKSDE